MLHTQVEQDQVPGQMPATPIGDLSAGMFAAVATLTGLVRRSLTESGTYADVSMADGLVSWMTAHLFATANELSHPGVPPHEPAYGLFRTADGWMSLSVAHEDHFWDALCGALGLKQHRALSAQERKVRYDELRRAIEKILVRHGGSHWEALLDAADVPFSPVLSLKEVLVHPHFVHRRLVLGLAADAERTVVRYIRQPLAIEGMESRIDAHVPRLGEHTIEVLKSAAYGDDEISALFAEGIVGVPMTIDPTSPQR